MLVEAAWERSGCARVHAVALILVVRLQEHIGMGGLSKSAL